MGFDKYRNFILQLGEEEEKLTSKYKSLIVQSPPKGLQTQVSNAEKSKTTAIRNIMATGSTTNKDAASVRGSKNFVKAQTASPEMIQQILQSIESQFLITSSPDRFKDFQSYFNSKIQDQTLDF